MTDATPLLRTHQATTPPPASRLHRHRWTGRYEAHLWDNRWTGRYEAHLWVLWIFIESNQFLSSRNYTEILTDAALLKRQKLEIDELRMKIQGSHAGVLEQEILKLRNVMLKYELEREKLSMELEEERKSQRERDRCLEQQVKTEKVNGVDTFSDFGRNSSQGQHLTEESNSHNCAEQGDAFSTPCFKPPPHAFVGRRGHRSREPEYSPLPDAFGDVADEETWQKLNKGFVVDLDSLHATPARKVQSFPSIVETPTKVLELWQNADAVCFNVDSTVCLDEGIDELAEFCGAGKAVAELTARAMNGSVPFEDALAARLSLFNPSLSQVQDFLEKPPRDNTSQKKAMAIIAQNKEMLLAPPVLNRPLMHLLVEEDIALGNLNIVLFQMHLVMLLMKKLGKN